MSVPDLDILPNLPADEDGPVFREPWEARAFALAVRLHEQGVFSWADWAETLGAAIRRAHASGDADLGDTYYRHWLACLETLVTNRGLTTREVLEREKRAAHDAHQRLHDDRGNGGTHEHH